MKLKINNLLKYIKKQSRIEDESNSINMEQLKQMINQNAVVIDVRSPQEYKEKHIKGALSIPNYEITKKAEKLLNQKQMPIVVYCLSGSRSKKAMKTLKKLGYINLFQLEGGIDAYPSENDLYITN